MRTASTFRHYTSACTLFHCIAAQTWRNTRALYRETIELHCACGRWTMWWRHVNSKPDTDRAYATRYPVILYRSVILIGMFNSNPMIPQYLNNNLTWYYRLGKFSMKCKVVGIFGEKLANIHFDISWICWIQKSCLPSWILTFRSRVTKNKMATKIEVFFKTLLLT